MNLLHPLVSIVMPAYLPGAYIREAVDSVLAQTWPNWELIIVNDGSTDGTIAYLDGLTDPRIRVIHQANQGVSVARNAALEVANGDFLTFLDADDVLPPESIAVRAAYLAAHPDIDLVDGGISFCDKTLAKVIRSHKATYCGPLLAPLLKLDASVFTQIGAFMTKRSATTGVSFKSGMTHSEDLLYFIEISCRHNLHCGVVGSLVYRYRTGHISAMTNMAGLEGGYFTLIKTVRNLPCATTLNIAYMRQRIAQILLLSWGTNGQWQRGLRAALTALFACRARS